jgi:DNA adenine methylase
MREDAPAAPFLKWAGGKRQIVGTILEVAPARIDTYYEPFVGGGAVFFALAGQGRFRRAVLADANAELIRCYQAVRDEVDPVIEALSAYRYDRAFYYRVRERDPARLTRAGRAARLIYLNRCGFNGLYRVNSKGRFNVPFGRYRNPVLCDPAKLRTAAAALKRAELLCADFEGTLDGARARDFVYLDPPYVPLSPTSSFTAYEQRGFDLEDQHRLARLLRRLGARGVPALLSNSNCGVTRDLYRGLRPRRVAARRAINSAAHRRGAVDELLVKSFAF